MCEKDRPTFNSLKFLTSVRGHKITKDPQIIDPYVYDTLEQFIPGSVLDDFSGYTRSFYSLEGHYDNLWLYDRPIVNKPENNAELDLAIQLASNAFKLDQQVTSYDWESLSSVPFIPSSGAGWGYVGKKGDPGNHTKAINRAVGSLNHWLETKERRASTPYRYHPDLAWTRTQLGTFESPKIRHVWGEAFENVILEGMSAAPLIMQYQAKGYPMAMGMHIYKRLPSIIQTTLADDTERRVGVGLDVKSFDSSVQPWLIREAFKIVESNLVFPDEYSRHAFDYTIEHFIRRPVVMPDGRMWLKQVGVPSGSYYTQIIDSIANLIVTYYAQIKVYGRTFKTYVLGDDSLFGVPETLQHPDPELFAPYFEEMGMRLSTKKCITAVRAQDLEFLGHVASGTRVDRDTAELLRLALYPEHPVSGPAISIARITGILIDSALCSWPIIHLYQAMKIKHRHEISAEEDFFPHESSNWLNSVVNIPSRPSEVDIVKTWTIT